MFYEHNMFPEIKPFNIITVNLVVFYHTDIKWTSLNFEVLFKEISTHIATVYP